MKTFTRVVVFETDNVARFIPSRVTENTSIRHVADNGIHLERLHQERNPDALLGFLECCSHTTW